MLKQGAVTQGRITFRSREKGKELLERGEKNIVKDKSSYYLKVPGAAINDHFQPISQRGKASNSFYIMAVPNISGFNPDYSGLDFCEEASGIIPKSILQ